MDPLKKIKHDSRNIFTDQDKEIYSAPLSDDDQERRKFGIADVARTLGITVSIL